MNACAILLAAGQSRRMGTFKPLLPFGGQSVVAHCLDSLQAAGVARTVVVIGHRAEEMRVHLADWPVILAYNSETGSAMGVSIARGVECLPADTRAILICLVDQPAVPPEAVRVLCEAWAEGRGRLLIPTYQGRGGHPVLLDAEFRNELLTLDENGGLRGFFATHQAKVQRVPVNSPYVCRDMDTWADYEALHLDVYGVLPAQVVRHPTRRPEIASNRRD